MNARFLVALVAGCNSQYLPRSRGHVAASIQDGKMVYVRDGHAYPHGVLGGGLVDAVAGNQAATTAANEMHDRLTTGLALALVGVASTFGGMGWAVDDAARDRNPTAPLMMTAGALLVTLVGAAWAATAEPYRWDAINLFNDAADQRPLPPPGWSASVHRETLRMRD